MKHFCCRLSASFYVLSDMAIGCQLILKWEYAPGSLLKTQSLHRLWTTGGMTPSPPNRESGPRRLSESHDLQKALSLTPRLLIRGFYHTTVSPRWLRCERVSYRSPSSLTALVIHSTTIGKQVSFQDCIV